MTTVNQKASSFFKEFQAFISRGNVVDLAVAVIVGAAFNNIVTSFVKDLVNPILGVIIGKPDFSDLFWIMKMPENYTGQMTYDALTKAGATCLGYGAFLTAVINFLLLALVIFFMLKFLAGMRSKFEAQRKAEEKETPVPPTPEDIVLLREIVAELKAQRGIKQNNS